MITYDTSTSVLGIDALDSGAIRVGIIGLGRSGWNLHAEGISKHPDFVVAAVADSEADRRAEAVARFDCAAYETPEALLGDENVELVIVATPSHLHAPLAIAAMDAGKHVLVEKPMALNLDEADAMLAKAQQTGKSLNVYQVRRTAPDFLIVRDIIESGVLGPLHLIKICSYGYVRRRDWQTLRKFGGGTLNNIGAHFIDQALTLAGGQWRDVLADVRHVVSAGDADDHVKVVFRGAEGVFVDVEISTAAAAPTAPPHWTILGRYGALTGTLNTIDWKYYDPEAVPERVVNENTPIGRTYEAAEALPWIERSAPVTENQAQALFYDALFSSLRQGTPGPATVQEIRDLTALFDACRAQNES